MTGERITDPATGGHALVLAGGEETAGAYVLAELEGCRGGAHCHTGHELAVEVLHGGLDVECDGARRRVAAGECVVIRSGCRHAWSGEAVLMVELRPAAGAQAVLERLLAS